jgi:hypothetical protein
MKLASKPSKKAREKNESELILAPVAVCRSLNEQAAKNSKKCLLLLAKPRCE